MNDYRMRCTGRVNAAYTILIQPAALPFRFLPWCCRVGFQVEFPQIRYTAEKHSIGGVEGRSPRMSKRIPQGPESIYDLTVKDAEGKNVHLSIYKGKVLLIVNVASKCGLTNSNYTELNQLYEKYKPQGLEVLAFPCNQFGEQEPGSNEQILEFVCTRFKSEFLVFDKIDVNGENAAPLYKFLKSGKYGIFGDDIQWNFSKFLLDKDGNIVHRYYPTTSPLSLESAALVKLLQNDIAKLLELS